MSKASSERRRADSHLRGETPDSYTVLNLHGSDQLTTGKTVHTFAVRLENATDELYRNHLSYIKDLTPEMGRSPKALYSMRF